MKNLLLIFLIFLLFHANTILAQNSYIRKGSIGETKVESGPKKETIDPFSFRPVGSWVGERFIFLPKIKPNHQDGYTGFKNIDGEPVKLNYSEFVGRVAKVISAGRFSDVEFEMEDNGDRVSVSAHRNGIDGIALISDIDDARKMWSGKTLWYKKNVISTYNEDTGDFGKIMVRKFSSIKVIGIFAGFYNGRPVRFILKTDSGKEGFVDVNMSGTNVSPTIRNEDRFQDFFFTINQKEIYNWSEKVWSAIERENISNGMTKEQVLMSWGDPDEKSKSIYGNVSIDLWK